MDYPKLKRPNKVPEASFNNNQVLNQNFQNPESLIELDDYYRELNKNNFELQGWQDIYFPSSSINRIECKPNNSLLDHQMRSYPCEEQGRNYVNFSREHSKEFLKNSHTPSNINKDTFYNMTSSRAQNEKTPPYLNKDQQKFVSQPKLPAFKLIHPKEDSHRFMLDPKIQCSQRQNLKNNLNRNSRQHDFQNFETMDNTMINLTKLQELDRHSNMPPPLNGEFSKFGERNMAPQIKYCSSSSSNSLLCRLLKQDDPYFDESVLHHPSQFYSTQSYPPEDMFLNERQKTSEFFPETKNDVVNAEKYHNVMALKRNSDDGYCVTKRRTGVQPNRNPSSESEIMSSSPRFSNNTVYDNMSMENGSLYSTLYAEEAKRPDNAKRRNQYDISHWPNEIKNYQILSPVGNEHVKLQYKSSPFETLLLSYDGNFNQNANSDSRYILPKNNIYSSQQPYSSYKEQTEKGCYKAEYSKLPVKINSFPQNYFPCKNDYSKLSPRTEFLQSEMKQYWDQNKQEALKRRDRIGNRADKDVIFEPTHQNNMCSKRRKVMVEKASVGGRDVEAVKYSRNTPTISATPKMFEKVEYNKTNMNLSTDYKLFNGQFDSSSSKMSNVIQNKVSSNNEKQISNLKYETSTEVKREEPKTVIVDVKGPQYNHQNMISNEDKPITFNKASTLNQEQNLGTNSPRIIVTLPKDLQIKLVPKSRLTIKVDNNLQTEERMVKKLNINEDINKCERNEEINKLKSSQNPINDITCKRNHLNEREIDNLPFNSKLAEHVKRAKVDPMKIQFIVSDKPQKCESKIEKCYRMVVKQPQYTNLKLEENSSTMVQNNTDGSPVDGMFSFPENRKTTKQVNLQTGSSISEPQILKINKSPVIHLSNSTNEIHEKLQNMEKDTKENDSGTDGANLIEENLTRRQGKKIKTYCHVSPMINMASDQADTSSINSDLKTSPDKLQYKNAEDLHDKGCLGSKKNETDKCSISQSKKNAISQGKKIFKDTRMPWKSNSLDLATAIENYSKKWSKQIQLQIHDLRRIRLKYWVQFNMKKNIASDDIKGRVEEDAFEALLNHVADNL